MWKLFLLFTVVPALELYLLVQIGKVIGAPETVLGVIAMGALGSWLAKREGLGLLRQLSEDMGRGIPPADRLVEGLLVIVGGVLLITPGVITDLFGILLLFPLTRRPLARLTRGWLVKTFMGPGSGVNFQSSGFFFRVGGDPGAPRPSGTPENPERPPRFEHPVS